MPPPLKKKIKGRRGGTPLYLSYVSFQMRIYSDEAGPKVQTFWRRLQQLDVAELQYRLLGDKRGGMTPFGPGDHCGTLYG